MGVCMGVKRALAIVERTLEENPGLKVYSLGPLIHNPRVVEEFRRRGLIAIENLARAEGGIVVVRAHGIGPAQKMECDERGLRCVDATCPKVHRIHEMVRERNARGIRIVIVGDSGHGEVQGISGYAPGAAIISSVAEAESVPLDGACTVVCQTTFRRAEYQRICDALRARRPDIEVLETTCSATERRQESLARLARKVDALLVIGGRNSANTRWLFQSALATGQPAWHIEGAGDIPPEIRGFERVGISGGASTPNDIIDEVERALLSL